MASWVESQYSLDSDIYPSRVSFAQMEHACFKLDNILIIIGIYSVNVYEIGNYNSAKTPKNETLLIAVFDTKKFSVIQ